MTPPAIRNKETEQREREREALAATDCPRVLWFIVCRPLVSFCS